MPSNLARVREAQEEVGEDVQWRRRMEEECDDEYMGQQGRWEAREEEQGWGEEAETYDAWAERIYSAFSSKRRPPPPKERREEGPRVASSLRPEVDLAKAEEVSRLLRERRKREKVRRMVEALFESEETVVPAMVPFKDMEEGEVVECLLEEVVGKGAEEVKKKIREELRRWHPDKFWQKVGSRVGEEHKEEVMERVKRVSQALNNYGK